MKFKRIMSVALAVTMVTGVFAGCGSSKPASTQESSTPSQSAAPASAEASKAPAEAPSGEFDWKKYAGSTIKVSFVQHSVSDAIVSKIADFEALTGIKVENSITPEANYFDKISTSLSSRSGDPDLFMTGAYQAWDYSTAGFIEPLDAYLGDPAKVTPDYDQADLVPSVINALKWDGVPGHAVGTGQQLAMPLACEIYTLAYNKRAFEKAGIAVPKTYDELLVACDKLKEWNGSGSYPLAIRGARNWGTIHPGYMSTYANFGAKDFVVEDGKLVSKVNSPESVKMNEFWVDLIKRGGAPSWASYTWYEAGADLGAGKAAMLFDADSNGVQQNWDGASQETGNLAWTVMPVAKEGDTPNSNFWTWAMAMNAASKNKDAAWYFLMYVTTKDFAKYASVTKNSIDPVRQSVWDDADFKTKMAKQEGYIDTFNKTIGSTTILFTPQPYFFQTTTDWAASLQDIVAGQFKSVQEGMDELKKKMDKAVEDIEM